MQRAVMSLISVFPFLCCGLFMYSTLASDTLLLWCWGILHDFWGQFNLYWFRATATAGPCEVGGETLVST
ncbi:hypothetical protein BJX68DRAFT_140779 [Aspergillus pseudodeflectus]|uniref:Secreted protein n=1 Tax=Aspergillus pseudodeflectus TaxID=176178 RepID=A0ABR4L2H2_9EURO